MNKLAFSLTCALSAVSANAANIIWISFSADDNTPSANAAAAGFTTAPDIGYTQALREAGHTVTRVVSSPTPNVSLLNSADLVIISRGVASGDYDAQAETAAWNGVTAPTMLLGGYILRNTRLGYTTGATIPDTTGNVTMSVSQPSHPIFTGITLGAGNTLSYAAPVNSAVGGALQRGISVNTDPLAGNGTLIASVTGDAGVTGTGMLIGEWQAGSVMGDAAPSDTLGGHRLVFLTGSREANGSNSEIAGQYDLTPQGRQLFLNAVNYMAVPEPSTYALLGLGALAIVCRRRRA